MRAQPYNIPRPLEMRQRLGNPRAQLIVQRPLCACRGLDKSADLLAVFGVGDAYDGGLRDGRVGDEALFDFEGGDVFAAADDHVFDAAGDDEEAVRVEVALVAGVEPLEAVFGRDAVGFGGALRVCVVARLDAVAAEGDFASLATDHGPAGGRVGDAGGEAGEETAGGDGALGHGVGVAGHCDDGGGFGEAPVCVCLRDAKGGPDLAHERLRDGGAGEDGEAQAGEVKVVEARVGHLGDEHCGHAVETRAAVFGDAGQRGLDAEDAGGEDERCPVRCGYGEADDEAEAVEERHGEADTVRGCEVHCAADVAARVVDAAVGEGGGFGEAGRAAGELEVHDVSGVDVCLEGEEVQVVVVAAAAEDDVFVVLVVELDEGGFFVCVDDDDVLERRNALSEVGDPGAVVVAVEAGDHDERGDAAG